MTGSIFYEFLGNVFYPWLLRNRIETPVILFVDGHPSHLTLRTSQFCKEHGIILIALYPNSTHITQPMDVSVFRSLKEHWKNAVTVWRNTNTETCILKKIHFSRLFQSVLERLPRSAIINGFKKAGLYPWCPAATLMTFREEQQNEELQAQSETMNSDIKSALAILEGYIGDDKVTSFKENGPDCDIEDKSLFMIWKKMHDDVQTSTNNKEPEQNSFSQLEQCEERDINMADNSNNDSFQSNELTIQNNNSTFQNNKLPFENNQSTFQNNIYLDHDQPSTSQASSLFVHFKSTKSF